MFTATPRATALPGATTPPALARTEGGDPRLLAAAVKNGHPTLLSRIGRFTVLERLGEGGMGIVYAAYDNELDRKVAVKVLRDDTDRRDPSARDRLLREAQAMARLSHPNIVAVHEAGWHEGQVFIAMEFVRGHNLGVWLQSGGHAWRDALGLLLQAGRGLAAAHAAGIVHRDFKPANTLVGVDGVVKVLDFGLARALGSHEPAEVPSLRLPLTASQLDTDITRTGAVLGTPAYMAPEQHLGEPATEKSDQFSFCVTLYEAVYGQHPFDTSSLLTLAYSITQGAVRQPPASTQVPHGVFQILTRGLAVDPNARFSSMPALLAALERARDRRHLPRLLPAALATLIAAAGFSAASMSNDAGAAACHTTDTTEPWDSSTREAARTAMLATGVPHASAAWDRVQPRLDAYAAALADTRGEACRAHAEGRTSLPLLERQTACLDERHAGFTALVGILRDADPDVVRNAATAVAALPPISTCNDTHAFIDAVAPPPPELVDPVARARKTLAVAHAHELAGQPARALELVDTLTAEHIAYPPLSAELGLRRGSLLAELGRHGEADAALTAALTTSLSAGHDPTSAAIATRRAFIRAAHLARPRDVLAEAPIVDGLVGRLATTGDGPRLHSDHLKNLGLAHAALGGHREARDLLTRALELLGPDSPDLQLVLTNLGVLAVDERRCDQAAVHFRRALELIEHSHGPDDPAAAHARLGLGDALTCVGDLTAARPQILQAVERAEALWSGTPRFARFLDVLGTMYVKTGELPAALSAHTRALALRSEPREQAASHGLLAEVYQHMHRPDLASAELLRARTLLESESSAETLPLARILHRLGDLSLARADSGQPLTAPERATARAHLERAIDVYAKLIDPDAAPLALARWSLVRTLEQDDPDRADLLAAQALATLEEKGDLYRSEAAAVTTWISGRAHKPTPPRTASL